MEHKQETLEKTTDKELLKKGLCPNKQCLQYGKSTIIYDSKGAYCNACKRRYQEE